MKRSKIFIIVAIGMLSSTWLLTSCDPIKTVLIANETGKDVRIQIIQDSTSQLSLGPNSKKAFELKKSGESAERRFNYGIGTFSKEDIDSFHAMIKQINIQSKMDTCQISGEKLLPYLPKKRLGRYNNRIEIKIKNCP